MWSPKLDKVYNITPVKILPMLNVMGKMTLQYVAISEWEKKKCSLIELDRP